MKRAHAIRRSIAVLIALFVVIVGVASNPDLYETRVHVEQPSQNQTTGEAAEALALLAVKGRAPKTGYERSQFGDGWAKTKDCDTRNEILRRDLTNIVVNIDCHVVSGTLLDPYTGASIAFQRGSGTSQAVQIDHVVALSDAWQKGAQQLTYAERLALANDPLELLAVDGPANQEKSDGDAASWLPPNRAFRCQYVARQIAVKQKYTLWVTQAEKDAMLRVLATCPGQALPAMSRDTRSLPQ